MSEQNASTSKLILVFNFSFPQGYKIISGSKIVSEQTACMCRLILDLGLSFHRIMIYGSRIYMCRLI